LLPRRLQRCKPERLKLNDGRFILNQLGEIPVKRKTSKSAAKRFKVTGTGKIVRHHSHARHILTKKSRKRVRKLSGDALVSKSDTKRVKTMLNI
jgi:large subunit ribosomal protein L35